MAKAALPKDWVEHMASQHGMARDATGAWRRMRPAPMAHLDTTSDGRNTSFALHQTVTFCEGEPIKATLADDGRPQFSESQLSRMEPRRRTTLAKQYISTVEMALVLEDRTARQVRDAIKAKALVATKFTSVDGEYSIPVGEAGRYIAERLLGEHRDRALENLGRLERGE